MKSHSTILFDLDGMLADSSQVQIWTLLTQKKAEVIEYALSECNIKDKSKVVMIGNRAEDMIGAQKVGIDSIGVEYGYGTFDELKNVGATYVVKDVKSLKESING